jgi:hypothetical protein
VWEHILDSKDSSHPRTIQRRRGAGRDFRFSVQLSSSLLAISADARPSRD